MCFTILPNFSWFGCWPIKCCSSFFMFWAMEYLALKFIENLQLNQEGSNQKKIPFHKEQFLHYLSKLVQLSKCDNKSFSWFQKRSWLKPRKKYQELFNDAPISIPHLSSNYWMSNFLQFYLFSKAGEWFCLSKDTQQKYTNMLPNFVTVTKGKFFHNEWNNRRQLWLIVPQFWTTGVAH